MNFLVLTFKTTQLLRGSRGDGRAILKPRSEGGRGEKIAGNERARVEISMCEGGGRRRKIGRECVPASPPRKGEPVSAPLTLLVVERAPEEAVLRCPRKEKQASSGSYWPFFLCSTSLVLIISNINLQSFHSPSLFLPLLWLSAVRALLSRT